MTPAQLVLAVHCHQPVGQLDAAFVRACDEAYRPLVDALGRHPHVRVALHLSGPLLDWLESNQPALLADVRALLERGQVELLGGGLTAPILSALTDRDALGQLEAMKARVLQLFGAEVRGAWLAASSWTPDLPRLLAPSGHTFTFVDQAQPGEAGGYLVTDHGGSTLALFPLHAELGARLEAGASPQEALASLRDAAKGGVLSLALAGERFGARRSDSPDARPWLDAFFAGLGELGPELQLLPPSEVLARRAPAGRAYPQATGGGWGARLLRFPDAQALRARMLHASKKVAEAEVELGELERLQVARSELYRGQAHDAYGPAGAVQPQLRHAAYAALIRADNLVDAETRGEGDFIEYEEDDLDADLRDEALLANAQVAAWVDPDDGGALYELDFRPLATCLTHVPGRRSFVDRFHPPGFGLEQLQQGTGGDVGGFAGQPYAIEASGVDEEGDLSASVTLMREASLELPGGSRRLVVEKTFHVPIDAPRLEAEYILENLGDEPISFIFAPELNFTLLAAQEPERYLELPDGRRASLAARLNHGATRGARLMDEQQGVAIELELDRDAELWSYPVERDGAYQGTCLVLRMPLALPPRESVRIVIRAELAKVELEPETPGDA